MRKVYSFLLPFLKISKENYFLKYNNLIIEIIVKDKPKKYLINRRLILFLTLFYLLNILY